MSHRAASLPSLAVRGWVAAVLLGVAAGCAPAASPASPVPTTGAPSFATSPTPVATATPTPAARPSGTLGWPTTFEVALEQGTYFSSPPFELPFTIDVSEDGWYSGHLHGEFFDLLRFDGVPHTGLPSLMVAFGIPEHVRGGDGDVPVEGLTAAAAADLVADAASLAVENRTAVELFGLEGIRIDVHSEQQNAPVFGGPAGNFGLGAEHDARMAVLQLADGLIVVLVLAPGDELDAAWDRAQRLLKTVELQ